MRSAEYGVRSTECGILRGKNCGEVEGILYGAYGQDCVTLALISAFSPKGAKGPAKTNI